MNVHARRGAGVRRRRVRDAVGREHDAARRRRLPLRDPGARRDRRRQGADPRRPLPRARDPHLRRARRPDREDLLRRRGLRAGDGRLPGADRDGRREEAPRARRADDGVPGGPGGRGRRRHGPQHLPERRPGGDDPGRREGRARRLEPGGGARALSASCGRDGRSPRPVERASVHAARRRAEPERRRHERRPPAPRRRARPGRLGGRPPRARRRHRRRVLPRPDRWCRARLRRRQGGCP